MSRLNPKEKRKRELARKFWQPLGFEVWPEDLKLIKGLNLEEIMAEETCMEWMPTDGYRLTRDIVCQMEKCGKAPAGLPIFLRALSELKNITGTRVCLFEHNGSWRAWVSTGKIQRSISPLFSGDGWGDKCLFAVVTKSAP
jgi:hypothetical protein